MTSKHFWLRMADGSGCEKRIKAKNLADACEQAEEWIRDGEWGDVEETFWVDCYVEDLARDTLETVTVQFDPPEPECCDELGHDWCSDYEIVGGCKSNPGVWGSGGGVKIVEACRHCGCAQITDTWGQRRDNGQQGQTVVTYEEGRFSDKIEAMRAEDDASEDEYLESEMNV